ncbi:hypothetical protein [Chitinophaga sp.]|uniref:hypothetical protein n=1 Tax=Chitinophaga sp. TaxID=1869181 RepID=UPI002CDEE04A|nr:hypothetical protein [Chitinophaga sp.]HWV67472.1 hypothetical protein [Chitinophaga sp.]
MSMHLIEDLVEETVHLTDTADLPAGQKRSILGNLFNLQSWYFDTGYTHFRVMDVLLRYRFVYKINLAAYPDIAASTVFDKETGGWVKTNDENNTPLGYAVAENEKTWLYFDAGGALWQRLCEQGALPGEDQEPPGKLAVPDLIHLVLKEAEKQQQFLLLEQWYALLVNAILFADFSAEDGIPPTFSGLAQHEVLSSIRAIVQRNQVGNRRKSNDSDNDNYLELPGLKATLETTQSTEEAYRIRFLLDLKKTVAVLTTSYQKEIKATAHPEKKTDLVFRQVNAFLEANNWIYAPQQEQRWLWYKDNTAQDRRFIMLDLDVDKKTLFCKQALQHALLLKWQHMEADTMPRHFHFYRDIVAFLPDDWMKKNKKSISQWGGWKYDIKKTEKELAGSIDQLTAALEFLGNTYFDFLQEEFPGKFFTRDPGQLLYVLENGEGELGIIPEYMIFNSRYHILLAFAVHSFNNGHRSRGTELLEKARAISESERINKHLKENILAPVFEHWAKHGEIRYPVPWNSYMLAYYS